MDIEEEVSLFDTNDKPEVQAVEEVAPTEETPSFQVPDKFEGKSYEDVVESYVNLEKAFGNKSNEVGELRKLTDEILKQQVTQNSQPVKEESINNDVGFDDFIVDPASAVDKALSNNPRLKQLEEDLAQRALLNAQEVLIARHSDAEEIANSKEFVDWVQSSPTRHNVLATAHANMDGEAAAEIIDMYKSVRKSQADDARDLRDSNAAEQLKSATTERGGAPSSTKPKYRRAELIRLKLEDPRRYESMSKEIYEAYADGRVI